MVKVYSTYGIGIAIALIAYFLILKLIGLNEYIVLSAVNAVFFGVGIYFALKKYREKYPDMRYETGFELGLFTGGIASIIFTVFMAFYMYQLDTAFAINVMKSWNLENTLGTSMLVIAILTMGGLTTLVLTFSFMQLFKKSWNQQNGKSNTP